MKKRRAFLLKAVMVALLLLLFAIPAQPAQAMPSISYDPALGLPTDQGYISVGGQNAVAQGDHLVIADNSLQDYRYFYRDEPDIPGRDITVTATVSAVSDTIPGSDGETGVCFVLDEGEGGYIIEVTLFKAGGLRKIGIEVAPNTFEAVFEMDWTQSQTIIFGKDSSGAFLEITDERKYVPNDDLPWSGSSEPRFAFGCFSALATVTARFGSILEVTAQTYPIVVTSPDGGENWELFSVQTITWTSTGVSGPVKIELSRDGGATWTTIIPLTPNDGSQRWRILRGATTQARIKVSSIANPTMFDISNANFTIVEPSITVTSPGGGESWKIGSTQTITWDSTSVLLVKIELSRDSGATWTTIAASIANHGSKSWKVTGPATTNARIRVVSLSNSASDISNADFTITP